MWGEMARIIREVRPRFVFVENSPMLTSRGLGRVLGDLATMGFDAKWGVLGAADIGAPHQRDRMWIVAKWRGQLPHAQHNRIRRWEQQQASVKEAQGNLANTSEQGLERKQRQKSERHGMRFANKSKNVAYAREIRPCGEETERGLGGDGFGIYGVAKDWWDREPANVPRTIARNVGGVANGLASRVDRLKAIGNGQVPLCAATAWRLLTSI
jgi:DNA (cytosine-5)-methyltransferase 1